MTEEPITFEAAQTAWDSAIQAGTFAQQECGRRVLLEAIRQRDAVLLEAALLIDPTTALGRRARSRIDALTREDT